MAVLKSSPMKAGDVVSFIEHNYRHFNAAALAAAARGYRDHIDSGGRMMVSLAGAMSTAEIGLSLAEMIRQRKVHAICCTGANLEEDIFNLIAHNDYVSVPNYRDLTPQQEQELLERELNRVTDTCIPEEKAIRNIGGDLLDIWADADRKGERFFPHEFLYQLIRSGKLEPRHQIDPRDSWLVAACERNLPVYVPGWEDSTLGNIFAAHCIKGRVKSPKTVKSGVEYMMHLADWYGRMTRESSLGFFQIGGGIAGDFAICVVPMMRQDLKLSETKLWGYFCQISESTTSYGGYSGAVPNEKITWEKLGVDTPRYIIESDASIVAPLMFAYVLHSSS